MITIIGKCIRYYSQVGNKYVRYYISSDISGTIGGVAWYSNMLSCTH